MRNAVLLCGVAASEDEEFGVRKEGRNTRIGSPFDTLATPHVRLAADAARSVQALLRTGVGVAHCANGRQRPGIGDY